MLHAVVRSERSALHFLGEVSGYNLQTLRQYVRQSRQDGDTLHVRVEIERHDQPAFIEHTERWWPALAKSGTVVEVEVVPTLR
jgi:hypothetical protein